MTDPASQITAEFLDLSGDSLLLLECPPGPWIPRFGGKFKHVRVQNSWVGAHLENRVDALAKHPDTVECRLADLPRPEAEEPAYDVVLYRLQKEGVKNQAALHSAFSRLRENGKLYVAGRNDEGIKSLLEKSEAVFGNAQTIRIKSSSRILLFVKTTSVALAPDTSEYFDTRTHVVETSAIGSFSYRTRPGLFAYRATDPATNLLLEHIPDCRGKKVVDLACGAGLLGLAAFRAGAVWVGAIDALFPAVEMTRANFREQGVQGEVVCADLSNHGFSNCNLLLTNPPFHSGKRTDYGLPEKTLAAAARALGPEGEAWVVANQFLPYARLAKGYFQECERVAKQVGFELYRLRYPLGVAAEGIDALQNK